MPFIFTSAQVRADLVLQSLTTRPIRLQNVSKLILSTHFFFAKRATPIFRDAGSSREVDETIHSSIFLGFRCDTSITVPSTWTNYLLVHLVLNIPLPKCLEHDEFTTPSLRGRRSRFFA